MAKELDTVFVFSGQGKQHVGMGRDIYENSHAVVEIFERASDASGIDIPKLCFENPDGKLAHAGFAQPAIVTLQVAGAKALEEKGIIPKQVAGHSLGEISATVVSGSITLEDAVQLANKRGTWMEEQGREQPGAMAASVGLDLATVEEICEETGTEVANVNSETQIVIAGKRDLMASVHALVEKYRGKFLPLQIDVASHCSLMIPVREKIDSFMQGIEVNDPKIPLITNVTARYVGKAIEIRDNLANQVASTVEWANSVRQMINQGGEVFYVIGPGDALFGLMKRVKPPVDVRHFDL